MATPPTGLTSHSHHLSNHVHPFFLAFPPTPITFSSFTSPRALLNNQRKRPRLSSISFTKITSCCSIQQTSPSPSSPLTSTPYQQQTLPQTFAELYSSSIPKWLLHRLSTLGFENPTPIQHEVLQHALPQTSAHPGQDVVIHAQTGCGKTLAYLLPAISAIDPHRSSIQALVVVPTQELGMQVYKLLRRLTSAYTGQHNPETQFVDNTEQDDENYITNLKREQGVVKSDFTSDSESNFSLDLDGDDDDDDDNDANVNNRTASFPVLPMLNQANLRRQKLQLRQTAPRIIVGNPHRIAELVKSGRLRLDLLKVLIVDEFDACLTDTSTTAALQTILSVRNRERDRQTILASATVPQHRHFLRQCVRQRWTRPDIRHIWLDEDSGIRVPPSLTHKYALCDARKKIAALRTLITRLSQTNTNSKDDFYAIVFVMTQRNIDGIVDSLNKGLADVFNCSKDNDTENTSEYLPVVGIHDDLPVTLRKSAVSKFQSGSARILIGTDVAARGLDFTHVSHVFHFDLPRDADAYLHRAGRAARLGRLGTSVVMVTRGEEFVVTRMANKLGIDFDRAGK